MKVDAPVEYIGGFIPRKEATMYFMDLNDDLNWERREDAPRHEYWTNVFGRPYTYGKGRGARTYDSKAGHPLIDFIDDLVCRNNHISPTLEGCFLNMYNDGNDALGWHSDDDQNIDHTRPIAVVTLGGPRAIQFRPIDPDFDGAYHTDYETEKIGGGNPYSRCVGCGVSEPQINGSINGHGKECPFRARMLAAQIQTQWLESGSLLLMHAGMQQKWLHRIPKAPGHVNPRISLTYRGLHKEQPADV